MTENNLNWNIGWDILLEKEIKNILIVGCGGGFDFIHSLLFYNDLKVNNKNIIIGSYSFGNPLDYTHSSSTSNSFSTTIESKNNQQEQKQEQEKNQNIIFTSSFINNNNNNDFIQPIVVEVNSNSIGSKYYCPELGYCSYLDSIYPNNSPHSIYTYYARAFTMKSLSEFYTKLINDHSIDVIIAVDGGTDSLMKGDEHGLGDPIEDAVSVGVIASLCSNYSSFYESIIASRNLENSQNIKRKPLGLLYSIGFGCDRFNYVSDASSLRAVSEITQLGGYLGVLPILPNSQRIQMYKDGLNHIYQKQEMRSILAGSILASSLGYYGSNIPSSSSNTVVDFGNRILSSNSSNTNTNVNINANASSDQLYLWPLMSMIWMFDITIISQRSLIVKWIETANTPKEAIELMNIERKKLFHDGKLLPVEQLPIAKDYGFPNYQETKDNNNNINNNNQKEGKNCCIS